MSLITRRILALAVSRLGPSFPVGSASVASASVRPADNESKFIVDLI